MRRTKEEAALTRAAIVRGALACFDRYGISGATLDQIARTAGVTKGAIYHHFTGKRELLREIRDQVSLPLLANADMALLNGPGGEASQLDRIERFLTDILVTVERDASKRQALTVMQFKCEYVGELKRELVTAVRNVDHLSRALEAAYREAHARGELAARVEPRIAALETMMFINGLVRLWLLQGAGGSMRRHARAAIRFHMASRAAEVKGSRKAPRRRSPR